MLNPFTRIAGWQALGLGLLFFVLTVYVGSISGVVFDGVLDVHFVEQSLTYSFMVAGISLVCLVLVMWIIGLLVAKRFRFLDLLGTLILSRAPYLIMAVGGFFIQFPDLSAIIENPNILFQNVSFYIMMILSLPVMVWNITLTYQAFRISCDLKGRTLTIALIAGLFFSEALSKIIIFLIQ